MSEMLEKARKYEFTQGQQIKAEDRPAFHITPYVGWMNDPNGFSCYKGEYHLFYQYNPYNTHWDSMHWGHVVSKDLLHWDYLPAALAPDQDYDKVGCFSGSAIELEDGRQRMNDIGAALETDENGVCSISLAPGEYAAQVMKAPQGASAPQAVRFISENTKNTELRMVCMDALGGVRVELTGGELTDEQMAEVMERFRSYGQPGSGKAGY